MSLNYQIEVAVPPDTNSTDRGRVLERFAKKFLETQNYQVQEEVRITATEVDLLGTEKTTAERIFVECKAHRSNISAEVLHKLLGIITFKGHSAGWLISTFALGKDAKGFEDEWNSKSVEERRRLRIYPPDKLIDRLISANIIVDPKTLRYDAKNYKTSPDAILLLTLSGEYWAIPVLDAATNIRSAALLFQANDGHQVTNQSTLDLIAKTDTTLALPWVSDALESHDFASTKLQRELDSIVRVPMADHWADYRPARPEDFIGRETVQSAVFQFFDAIKNGTTGTRLLALKGPSGWGKSSCVLKIASRAANVRNRGKYFVFTVDSRAATTSRFPELAVLTAVKEAIKKKFIQVDEGLEFGGASNFFSAPAMRSASEALQSEDKVLCIFFDQFEELLYKADLSEVFNEMRRLCSAVEEAQTNIAIGFSWKTDGVIPTEHNAYHMWHSLSEHRTEVELSPFSEREVSLAINRFSKELRQPVTPQLRRLLQDHCQGFPWLLKKLCVHILELSNNGIDQGDILGQSLNIQTLFKRDLENLSPTEVGCLKQIASESPAEFFKISQNFGDEIVSRLIDKRLIIRSGTRLTIYWDIFRDYILTEKIPYIPVTYVPQASFGRYATALAFMFGKSHLTYTELGKHMGLSMGATDNLVRDLANLGHVEADRREAKIVPQFRDEEGAIAIAFSFWRTHDIVRGLYAKYPDKAFTEIEFEDAYRLANKRTELGEATLRTYTVRVLGWLRGLGIVAQIGRTLMLQELSRCSVQSLEEGASKRLRHSDFFLGEAPPAKVVTAFQALCSSPASRHEMESQHGRNTCYVLVKLALMRPDGTALAKVSNSEAARVVAQRASEAPMVRAAHDFQKAKGNVPGLDYGRYLAERFGARWSEGSMRRYGTSLRQWAEWSAGVIDGTGVQVGDPLPLFTMSSSRVG